FWQMGETGPCGPCSEIFYDLGLKAAETPGVDKPFGHDDARYVEIWNLVFMQFDRAAVTENGEKSYKLTPLPRPSIDTGMGLERLATVMQGKISNFETDLFTPLIQRAAQYTGVKNDVGNASLRIIADHARAATFLIHDGVVPSNEGRGYVLRKILRRGIRHGRLQGQEQPFLFEMVYAVRDQMESAYPELANSAPRVAKVVESEERQFARVLAAAVNEMEAVLDKELMLVGQRIAESLGEVGAATKPGLKKFVIEKLGPHFVECEPEKICGAFEQFFGETVGRELYADLVAKARQEMVFRGDVAFHLYETYGLPLDFMMEGARDRAIRFDLEGFEKARTEEQARARASWKGGSHKTANPAYRELPKTDFLGYKQLTATGAEVLAIVK